MTETRTLEIRLPRDADLGGDDLDLLRTACEALVGLACRTGTSASGQIEAMSAEGWTVRTGLTWIAHAERGKESEEATGDCRNEALCRLCQLTGLRTVDGCP